MEMKEEDFLQSLGKNTRKSYKTGLRKFEQYFGKSVDEILKLREQDLGSDDLQVGFCDVSAHHPVAVEVVCDLSYRVLHHVYPIVSFLVECRNN